MITTVPGYVSRAEFDELFRAVCNWGRWGEDDERGTLNYIQPEHIRRAAGLVRLGRSVSMAVPVNKVAGPDNPHPAMHYMARGFDAAPGQDEPRFCTDYLASEVHGYSHTHIDALCHVSFNGRLYNGKLAGAVTSVGPTLQDITAYAHGVIGRGVLLDIPRLRGVKWLEPGEAVATGELEAAERAQGVRLEQGDIFVFRTGHHRRRLELGAWNNGPDGEGRAGLHVETMRLLHERQAAAFLPDGDGETVPCRVEGIGAPIHALQIASMGMACADSLNLEDVARVCEEQRRWEFLLVAAPLRLPGGTGSLFNPLAIF